MITLTNPKIVNSVLGGTATVSYNKLVVTFVHYDIITRVVTGNLKLVASADSTQTPLLGSFVIRPSSSPAIVQVDIPDLPFHRIITLTAGQTSTADAFLDTIQAQIENGFISLVAVAGIQSAGV